MEEGTPAEVRNGQVLPGKNWVAESWQRFLQHGLGWLLTTLAATLGAPFRPFVVGHKAWLFSDRPAGAHASAVIYSPLETAKANGLEPYTWLRHVMRSLPLAKTVDEVEALLPWNCIAMI